MKISYSWIKEFIDVKISPEKLADKLSMAGLSVATLERVADDWVYDIEVTSNRPDWLSVRGIVREIAAVTGAKLKKTQDGRRKTEDRKNKKNNRQTGKWFDLRSPSRAKVEGPANRLTINIENTKDCALYHGRLIRGVKVAPSPEGIQKRLRTLGLRPVNNVVDVTNYCLWETGQPLHAFDFDKIVSPFAGSPVRRLKIVVRRAKKGEEIVTIDGVKRDLNENILVIASEAETQTGKRVNRIMGKPIAAAGIMGGVDTQVDASTRNIFLESACFGPGTVRRGSRALGVSSDSSYRFERGVDGATVQEALERATEMICALAGGHVVATQQAGKRASRKMPTITLILSKAMAALGMRISGVRAKSILKKLGFGVTTKSKDAFSITIPSWRRDVRIPEDLSEELARVFGYDKIPLTVPAIKPFVLGAPPVQMLETRLKNILSRSGLKEVITYSLISDEDLKRTSLEPAATLALENPPSREYRILRDTLIPSLLGCASFNLNHGNKDLEIFEVAHVFARLDRPAGAGGAKGLETVNAGILLCGEKRSTWLRKSGNYDIFDLKGIVEALCDELQVKNYAIRSCEDLAFAQAGAMCQIVAADQVLGVLGKVSATVKKAWGIKGKEDVYVAEMALESLAGCADLRKRFTPLVGVPSILRDISVLVDKNAPYDRIKALIETRAAGFVRRVSLADTYQGKEIPEGSSGLTITIEYGATAKTLTDVEVNSVHQRVLDSLVSELSLKIR